MNYPQKSSGQKWAPPGRLVSSAGWVVGPWGPLSDDSWRSWAACTKAQPPGVILAL